MVDNENPTNHLSLYSDTDYEADSMYPCSSQSFWSDGDLSADLEVPSSSAISHSFDLNISEEIGQIGYSLNIGTTKAETSFPKPSYGDAIALYRSPVTSFNPSAEGEHAYQELMELTHWANECLSAGLVKVHVNDLAKDLGDGLTLLDLVEVLTGESPPQLHIKPCLQVQKTENIQACLEFLNEIGVSVHSISAEDIAKGNMKVVLALCHCLKRAYGSPAGPGLQAINNANTSLQSNYETVCHEQPINGGLSEDFHGGRTADIKETMFIPVMSLACSKKTAEVCMLSDFPNNVLHEANSIVGYSGSPVDFGESDTLLQWVSKVTDQLVTDYSDFKNGDLLCRLVKEVSNRSVPERVMAFGSPSEKISWALQIFREKFGSCIVLQTDDVIHSPYKLSVFLKQLRNSLTKDMRQNPTYIFESARKKCDLSTGSTPETTSQRLHASELPFVAYSKVEEGPKHGGEIEFENGLKHRGEIELESGQKDTGEIEFYEKEKRYYEAQSPPSQGYLAENFTAKLDVNGNCRGYHRAIDPVPHSSACDYLNQIPWKDVQDYGHNTDFTSSRLNVKKEMLSPKEANWRDSITRFSESMLPVYQEQAASKSQHYFVEESSVFEPSDKWKTPNSQDLKTGKLSERQNARQRLRELQRNLECLKLKYRCHTEKENENIGLSTVDVVPNIGRIYSSPTAEDMAQPLHDNSSARENILNITYPAVELNKDLRLSSSDLTSRKRPFSAESRPKSICSLTCNGSPSTYYSKFPDVLNKIKTQKNDGAEFPSSAYIEASESQLFLPRSRPLGISDPVSARTKKRLSLPEFFRTPNTGLTTRTNVSDELLDNQSNLSNSLVDSVFTEHESLPISKIDSIDVTACSNIFSDKEFSSSPFKPSSLTALIRMTAKKASG